MRRFSLNAIEYLSDYEFTHGLSLEEFKLRTFRWSKYSEYAINPNWIGGITLNSYPQSISTFSTCAGAYQTYTAIRGPFLKLTFFAMFLPMVVSELILSQLSIFTVQSLKELTKQFVSTGSKPDFPRVFEAITSFYTPCFLIMLLLVFILYAAFMGLVKLAAASETQETLPSARTAFAWGLRQLFPKGLIMLAVFFFFGLERFLWGPFRILSMLILMAPVLYTMEGRRLGSSFHRSLFLKFVNPTISTGFNVAFTLIVFGALIFFGENLISIASRSLLTLDHYAGLSRDFWTLPFLNFPFSIPFFLVNLLASLSYAFLIASLPLFTVQLYLRTTR